MRESAHLTPNFVGPFIINEKVGRASFKVTQCHTMKELPSPVHAERMKVAPFGSVERLKTEEIIFGRDTREAKDAAANEPTVTEDRYTRLTDQTATETVDVEQLSEDGIDMDMTPVEIATQTTDGQGHDVGTESPNEDDDKGQTEKLCPIERLLKARIVRGQRFYFVKWGVTGKASDWVAAKNILGIMIDNVHKRHTLTGRKRRTRTQ